MPFNMSTFASPKNDPPSAKEVEALRRYQHLWLPLVTDTANSNLPLIPPPDNAWLRQCHRLAPHQYSQYCQQTFRRGDNKTIEANPPFTFASPEHSDDNAVKMTNQMWKDTYPNESFFLSSNTQDGKHSISDAHPLIGGFDLVGSARCQTTFLWQVSGEPYKTDLFLESGRDNYERFLKLIIPAKQLNIILAPTYQIDFM
jgi:Glycine-rich domain-containing protein-like